VTAWVSPVPAGVGNVGPALCVFRPGTDLRRVAGAICERAWRRGGVRVYLWPCGTIAVARCAQRSDEVLLRDCLAQLFATYARDGQGRGPLVRDVLQTLQWARGRACIR